MVLPVVGCPLVIQNRISSHFVSSPTISSHPYGTFYVPPNQDGAIALTLAAAEGHVPIVSLLIAAKAEINYVGAVSHRLVYVSRDYQHVT
jgi:ankyrin repeat protein